MKEAGLIDIPDFSLVLLVGATGSGKSTFAARWFAPTEIVSSDRCRGLVADDENDQAVSSDAFALAHEIAARRLKNRRIVVIDATNVRASDRREWVEIARAWHALPVAIEALTRFVAGAPLRRVHECVFAVLALESEPIDPRL